MHGRPAHPDPILHRAAHPRPWLRHTVILKRVYSPRGIRNTTPQTFQVTPTLLLISHSVRSQLVNDTLFNQYGVAAAVSGGHVPRPLDRPALPDKRVPAGQQESPCRGNNGRRGRPSPPVAGASLASSRHAFRGDSLPVLRRRYEPGPGTGRGTAGLGDDGHVHKMGPSVSQSPRRAGVGVSCRSPGEIYGVGV